MSNYNNLKSSINNNIYENQTQQITGTVLNAILNEMTNALGAGYQFAGVATVGMTPSEPDARIFYLAGEGIYTSFDGIQVPAGKLGILKWDNRWHLETIDGLGSGGANLTGYVTVASTDDLPDEGVATLGYLCGENLYLYVGEGGDTKEGKYQNCGSFRGPQGDSVQDVEQTQTSLENGGVNKIKFTLSNGISCEFQVRNGTTSSGLFPTLAALQAAYPSPVVGQYAFVGAGFPADIYVCTTAGTWTDSGEDYDGDNVDLTDYATKAEVSQLQQEVDDLEAITYDIAEIVPSVNLADPSKFVTGKIMTKYGTESASESSFYMEKIPVSQGDKIFSTLPRSVTAFNNGTAVTSAFLSVDPDIWDNNSYYEVPSGVTDIVINGYNSRLPYMVTRGGNSLPEYSPYKVSHIIAQDALPEIPEEKLPHIGQENIEGMIGEESEDNVELYSGTLSDGYMTTNGTIGGSGDFVHTEKINVQPGDILACASGIIPSMRFICAFNSNDEAYATGGSAVAVRMFTIISGVASVVVSWDIRNGLGENFHLFIIRKNRSTEVKSYVERTELVEPSIVKSGRIHTMPTGVSGAVDSGHSLFLDTCASRKKTMVFRGDVTSFTNIYFGLMHNGTKEMHIKLDGTNLYIYNKTSLVSTDAHGLTISGYLAVTIVINNDDAKITVATVSGVFQKETDSWTTASSTVFAQTDASSLASCFINLVPTDINERVWVLGDSYMSFAENRVGYWLNQFGAKSFLLNATPGETSMRGELDLYFLLGFATPAVIVWMMGMNDGDTSNAVSERWLSAYEVVKTLCEEKGITLVLYTVPTVPSVSNEFKDAIVRASGYRYIDGYAAVGANSAGVWYSGMLSNDEVHPSITGAIAIAQEAIIKVPELFG